MQIRQLPGGGLGGRSGWRGLLQERLRGGGTDAAQWAFRRGIREAGEMGEQAIRRYYAQLGRTGGGPEEARISKFYSDLALRQAEGLAGITERSQTEALRLAMGRRPVTARVRVSTRRKPSWQETTRGEAYKTAFRKKLTEEYYKIIGG